MSEDDDGKKQIKCRRGQAVGEFPFQAPRIAIAYTVP